jgi:ribonuclease VapC
MSVFVDASVLVSLLAREDDWPEWSQRVDAESEVLTSPIETWEAIRAVQRITKTSVEEVERQLRDMLEAFRVRIIPISDEQGRAAIRAHAEYGKGRHPAKLNLGDCFSYACAKTSKAKLLYKGDDFSKTDLA